MTPEAGPAGDSTLVPFGYAQELRRGFKLLASFGLAFCHISPVVGVYTLYGYGLSTGGPAFLWGLPFVVAGQLLVVFVFSELTGAYPIAGALYQWGRRLVGPRYGWFVGWTYGWALVVTIAAVDLGAAPYLAALLGLPLSQGTFVILALGLLVLHTLSNDCGIQGTSFMTTAGLVAEVAATLVLGGVLLLGPGHLHPASVLFSRETAVGSATAAGLLASLLAHAWTFYGFEAAAGVAEEVVDPGRRIPRAMILSLLGAAGVTAFLLVALILATPDIAKAAADPDRAIPDLLASRFGGTVARGLLALLVFAYVSCSGAAQTAAARLFYSYARDGMLPGSAWLRRVSQAHRAPANATLLSALGAAAVISASYLTVGNVNVNAFVVSYAVVGIYLSLQAVVFARIWAGLKGWTPRPHPGDFSLGGLSLPVAFLAQAYGLAMIVNLSWPRPASSLSGWLTLLALLVIVTPGVVLAWVGPWGSGEAPSALTP
ncbi:MAG TPA: amino acid permease [Vicinamibacteria bacterium]|jgi:amino acid transporter|nr:amino acid permease [Vicinamibacteria bacterium]